MNTTPQELASRHAVTRTFFDECFDILNAQAPAREVHLGSATIDYLNNLGMSGIGTTTATASGTGFGKAIASTSVEGTSYNELSATTELLRLTVGVIGVIVANPSPQSTTTVMIKPERRGRFTEMAATLNNFAFLAKEVIPNMRELTVEERKDLKLFFKKSYKKF
jgi:hypothetical protein